MQNVYMLFDTHLYDMYICKLAQYCTIPSASLPPGHFCRLSSLTLVAGHDIFHVSSCSGGHPVSTYNQQQQIIMYHLYSGGAMTTVVTQYWLLMYAIIGW